MEYVRFLLKRQILHIVLHELDAHSLWCCLICIYYINYDGKESVMKLYIKQCRPYQVSLGGQGFNDNWIPLEDWQDEDNEAALREKYPDKLLQKKDAFSILKFQYRYVEYKKSK